MASSRTLKSDVEMVDGSGILQRLADLPIYRWRYRAQDGAVSHLGPMAEDFYAAFGLGVDGEHIVAIDSDGVALAAIQALHQELQESRAKLSSQEAEIVVLRERIADLEHGRLDGSGVGIKILMWVIVPLMVGLQAVQVRMWRGSGRPQADGSRANEE